MGGMDEPDYPVVNLKIMYVYERENIQDNRNRPL